MVPNRWENSNVAVFIILGNSFLWEFVQIHRKSPINQCNMRDVGVLSHKLSFLCTLLTFYALITKFIVSFWET